MCARVCVSIHVSVYIYVCVCVYICAYAFGPVSHALCIVLTSGSGDPKKYATLLLLRAACLPLAMCACVCVCVRHAVWLRACVFAATTRKSIGNHAKGA